MGVRSLLDLLHRGCLNVLLGLIKGMVRGERLGIKG
jgi:hypothetical protein